MLQKIKHNMSEFEYSAVIIEPRQHKALELVLQNFTRNLDDRWHIIVCHGMDNEDFVKHIVHHTLSHELHRIKLIKLPVSNLTIPEYNRILYDTSFYDIISTDLFLLFQTDTLICDKYRDKIYEFVAYDYVGAPWANGGQVGNGGLSLRRKQTMLDILAHHPLPIDHDAEDVYFSSACPNKPLFEQAKEFAIETVFNDQSFGIHKPWNYQTAEQLHCISAFCTDLPQLMGLL